MSNAVKIGYLVEAVEECVKDIRRSAGYAKSLSESDTAYSEEFIKGHEVKAKMLEYIASKIDSEVLSLVEKYLEESF